MDDDGQDRHQIDCVIPAKRRPPRCAPARTTCSGTAGNRFSAASMSRAPCCACAIVTASRGDRGATRVRHWRQNCAPPQTPYAIGPTDDLVIPPKVWGCISRISSASCLKRFQLKTSRYSDEERTLDLDGRRACPCERVIHFPAGDCNAICREGRSLRQAEGGVKVAELCRMHGMSNAPFYKCRAK